jgi:hypothetical protein
MECWKDERMGNQNNRIQETVDRSQELEFRRRETEVSMTVAGYSILDPGCCPNPEEEKTEW